MVIEQSKPRIVVGVDGSPSSLDALRWAVRQARLTAAAVHAIATWEHPVLYGGGYYVPMPDDDIAAATGKVLAESVRSVLGEEAAPVEVREEVMVGNAAQVLLDAAHGAELLVLGSRGHGGFTGALLGSVGQHCVHHAACPVVIVRHGSE
jgi:nucleotide-binding universal stress UspA family protein